jgi:hypothetical protein
MKLLPPASHIKAKEPLAKIQMNTLFARAVVEGHNPGKVFVDDVKNPSTFFIAHTYGISLLFGSADN